jgi:glycerol uptake facilitator protein
MEKRWLGEVVGTMLLILFGSGVVANVVLGKTKGHASDWIVIAMGWGMAVAIAVYAVGWWSGAHLNPAITLALALTHQFSWADVPLYLISQFVGAFIGAALVWLAYYPHWSATEDPGAKLAVFSTTPAIRHYVSNFVTEVIGTFALVFGVLAINNSRNSMGSLGPLMIGFLVLAIGLSLGGPTGYAINPARDLGPRVAHSVLPISGKGDSDWSYAWVPALAPIVGGALGSYTYIALFPH